MALQLQTCVSSCEIIFISWLFMQEMLSYTIYNFFPSSFIVSLHFLDQTYTPLCILYRGFITVRHTSPGVFFFFLITCVLCNVWYILHIFLLMSWAHSPAWCMFTCIQISHSISLSFLCLIHFSKLSHSFSVARASLVSLNASRPQMSFPVNTKGMQVETKAIFKFQRGFCFVFLHK